MEAIEVGGLSVHRDTIRHPLLGEAHVIEHAGRPVTAMSAIDWERPTCIPTVAEPRLLPPGTGSLLMNDIAERALRAGVQTLRYAGPYPTHALWKSLLRSFRTTATVSEFTRDVLTRTATLARDEVPVDFTPAPFTRRGDADLREGAVDRVRIAGVSYDTEGEHGSLALLSGSRAILSVGIPIAHIATIAEDGSIVDGPRPIPAVSTGANGQAFPQALLDELAELASELVIPPLATDVAHAIRTRRTVWADLGWRSARVTPDGFEVHVALLALARDHMDQFAAQLSHHLATIAQQAVLSDLMARPPLPSSSRPSG